MNNSYHFPHPKYEEGQYVQSIYSKNEKGVIAAVIYTSSNHEKNHYGAGFSYCIDFYSPHKVSDVLHEDEIQPLEEKLSKKGQTLDSIEKNAEQPLLARDHNHSDGSAFIQAVYAIAGDLLEPYYVVSPQTARSLELEVIFICKGNFLEKAPEAFNRLRSLDFPFAHFYLCCKQQNEKRLVPEFYLYGHKRL